MRILYVGYGFYPERSGGAALIQWEIVKSSRKLGYQPVIFQAGSYNLRQDVRLEQKTLNDGILLFNLINSPNRPGNRNPKSEVSNEVILKVSREVLQTVKPDIVHIHELTFHCMEFIDECRKMGIPIVKTIHNYWDVCPQRDLLYNGEIVCTDYLDGLRCVDCRPAWTQRPRVVAVRDLLLGGHLFCIAQRLWHGWQRIESFALKRFPASLLMNVEVDESARHDLAKDYAYRREAFVQRLNRLNRIHVYSRRSMYILTSYGVEKDTIQFIPVSTEAIDKILPGAPHKGELPIRFGYRGGLAPHKGVHILIEAFKRLDQSKAKLIIYGIGNSGYTEYLKRLGLNLNMEFRGKYLPEDLTKVNSTIDVGIIPSIWEELFGLVGVEYFQSLVPVIASDIGGITEYVVHGENGILVKAGNEIELAKAMQSFVDQPMLVRNMQRHILRWKSVLDMTRNLADMYQSVLERTQM